MYVHAAFKTDEDAAWEIARQRGFGLLTAVDDGWPVASPVPFVIMRGAGGARLGLHLARVNPLVEVMTRSPRVLIAVSGPDAYVSPDWYVSPDQVPTWNYVAVHIRGHAHRLPPEATRAHIDALSLDFEERLRPKRPWATAKMSPKRLEAMLAGIVAFEIDVERVETSLKLGQNKSVADRREVARMLAWRGGWAESAVSEAMLASLAAERRLAKAG